MDTFSFRCRWRRKVTGKSEVTLTHCVNARPDSAYPPDRTVIDQIIQTKESYRANARALSWEEKIASIERMREASKIARACAIPNFRIET